MHLLIDLQHIQFSFNTGIINFSFDLVKGFVKYSNWDIVLLVWDDQEGFIDKNLGIDLPKIVVSSQLKKVSRLRRGLCPSSIKKEIDKRGVDVILTVCFTISSYLYPKKYHQIGVIHDIQLLKIRLQERDLPCALYMFSNMFVYFRLLKNLVTISDFVRHDVKKLCGRDSGVIYNSICRNTENEQEIETIKNTPYILDVNSFFKYKNTENLIRAFSRIKDIIPHVLYRHLPPWPWNKKQPPLLFRQALPHGSVPADIHQRCEACSRADAHCIRVRVCSRKPALS